MADFRPLKRRGAISHSLLPNLKQMKGHHISDTNLRKRMPSRRSNENLIGGCSLVPDDDTEMLNSTAAMFQFTNLFQELVMSSGLVPSLEWAEAAVSRALVAEL